MDNRTILRFCRTSILLISLVAAAMAVAEDKLLVGEKVPLQPVEGENYDETE